MQSISECIIQNLTQITGKESAVLQSFVDKKFVASCVVPPLVRKNQDGVKCNIAVVAPVSGGKSTLFNSLCGYPILPVGTKTTSCSPTYITRVKEQSQEEITVYALKKKIVKTGNLTSICFERDTATKRTYSPQDISPDMYQDLFEYMYFVVHGTELEYKITVENVAYFMVSEEKSDILFNGMDAEKRTIQKEDFALSYDNPRHRLLLLLILLCVYVNQNDSEQEMSKYTQELNQMRTALLRKYGYPIDSDYCVCLNWCSEDIPEGVTLIDLPGTGAATLDDDLHSSHTALVRGILTEADALWVLCSDNGTTDHDLLTVLQDVIEGNVRKNKVCIYNCKNGQPNDSGPVTDFLAKLPCLTGERCYVLNAMAGEYKYVQNGVKALSTKTASKKRYDGDEPTETGIIKQLETMYSSDKKAYCTFTTNKDAGGYILAMQDSSLKYNLDSFFKNALTDYVERLKYEVALNKAIEQAKFYLYIRDSLSSSKGILESINGKGSEISDAVNQALSVAVNHALNNYISRMTSYQTELAAQLAKLGNTASNKIAGQFAADWNNLIAEIKAEWKTMETEGHPNCLEANWLTGNYSLNPNNPNLAKFKAVRDNCEGIISVSAFSPSIQVIDGEMKNYENSLNHYIQSLKNITSDFHNDYIDAFLSSYDKKCDELCKKDGKIINDILFESFQSARKNLKAALEQKIQALCAVLCDSFEILVAPNGIFDKVRLDATQEFMNVFSQNILNDLRNYMYVTFTGKSFSRWFSNHMKPADLQKLLNEDFSSVKEKIGDDLVTLVNKIYGTILDGNANVNFPNDLSTGVQNFNGTTITETDNKIQGVHQNITALVSFGADMAVDLTAQIQEIQEAMVIWREIGTGYEEIVREKFESSEGENTQKLYEDCAKQVEDIVSEGKS